MQNVVWLANIHSLYLSSVILVITDELIIESAQIREGEIVSQGLWLYRYEAKSIQSFVLATDRLREIKGGSALIEGIGELFKDAYEACTGLKAAQSLGPFPTPILYSAAGGSTAVFPDENSVQDFAAHWPMLMATYAPGLQIAQGFVPWEESDTEAHRALVSALVADQKRFQVDAPEAGPMVQRAPRSGLPAIPVPRPVASFLPSEKLDMLVDAQTLARLYFGYAGSGVDPIEVRLRRFLDGATTERFAGFLEDFDTEAEESSLSRLAVLHIDGNDIGQVVRDLVAKPQGGLLRLAEFSEKLTAATEAAVGQALAHLLATFPDDCFHAGKFAGRPVVIGGDDLTMIIKADLALPFVEKYLTVFQAETTWINDYAPRSRLTATAGIAFVGRHYPFRLGLDLATDLCDFAKEQTRGLNNGRTPSSLLFHRVTTALSADYRTLLGRELAGVGAPGRSAVLAMGPYLLAPGEGSARPDISMLKHLIRSLGQKAIPTSGVRDLIGLYKNDPLRVQARLARLDEVCEDKEAGSWRQVTSAIAAFGFASGEEANLLCQDPNHPPDGLATPILDAQTVLQMEKLAKAWTDGSS